jgi:hypothetical protein
MEEDKVQSESSKRLKAITMEPTTSSSLSTTAAEQANVSNDAIPIGVNETIASIEKKEACTEDLFRWSDCRRQEAILLGNMQLLQIHITAAAHSKSKKEKGEENEMKGNIQKLRIELFQNAFATLTTFNEIISNALILANHIAIASGSADNSATEMNKAKIVQLQDICNQTSLWSEMMKNNSYENKTDEKVSKIDERVDLDLVVDEDIVILDGKKPRNNDLLCPISCKPFVQPMIK